MTAIHEKPQFSQPLREPNLIGRTLSHYRISAAIGAGGMGEVYRATDTKLGRDVALKVLPADLAGDSQRLARFQREARALAALCHPHIVTIFSVEEVDGVHFLTMELVEGRSLDHTIPAGGMALEQIVEIASALAGALSAAHEKGIVHRDLKPANIMITHDGHVKVLDFGLAKDVHAESSSDLTVSMAGQTREGVVMGTPAYMSPEQVSGRVLDHRTDIFSLGVVLHEMATGRRPFSGESTAELTSAILRDHPAPVTDLRDDLSIDLARIIRRCLEKDPRHRVQTARDVSNEFRDLGRQNPQRASTIAPVSRSMPAAHSGAIRADEGFWVAVLPFKYAGASPELTALADGMSEDVITGLSRFSYLRVIARGSTLRYANQAIDLRVLGRELGARYIMEGNLRQSGSKLRTSIQLVDTISGTHLWAQTYDHAFDPDAIFELQDDLVPRLVSTIADEYGVLTRSLSESLRSKKEDEFTPHEAVLRAFSYFERITPDEHAIVGRILERAVQQAPEHADSLAMLSMIYRGEYAQGFNPKPNSLERALATAQRAVDAGPSNHIAYYALATTYFFQKDKLAFRSAAERSIALNPMDGSTMAFLGLLMEASAGSERGIELVKSGMRLNPNYPGWYKMAIFNHAYYQHKYQEALDAAIEINLPGYFHAHAARTVAYAQIGELDAARKALQDLLALRPNYANEARQEYSKWFDPDRVEHVLDGLRKSGLAVP